MIKYGSPIAAIGFLRLFLKYFLYLPNFLLHPTGQLFRLTLSLQVGFAHDLAELFLDCALRFVKGAFDLIVCTGFHVPLPQASFLLGSNGKPLTDACSNV